MAFSVPGLSFDPFATTNEALQAPSVRHPMGDRRSRSGHFEQLLGGSRVSYPSDSWAGVLATAVGVLVGAVSGTAAGGSTISSCG
jgi:ABC-type dipeptide/oligopeptide/nickel transport system permease subunit